MISEKRMLQLWIFAYWRSDPFNPTPWDDVVKQTFGFDSEFNLFSIYQPRKSTFGDTYIKLKNDLSSLVSSQFVVLSNQSVFQQWWWKRCLKSMTYIFTSKKMQNSSEILSPTCFNILMQTELFVYTLHPHLLNKP